jgi:hypothetical protein
VLPRGSSQPNSRTGAGQGVQETGVTR